MNNKTVASHSADESDLILKPPKLEEAESRFSPALKLTCFRAYLFGLSLLNSFLFVQYLQKSRIHDEFKDTFRNSIVSGV